MIVVETGRVTKIADGKAWIVIARGAACAECQAECHHEPGKSVMLVEANDPIGVHVNQYVQITIQNENVLRASFVVYMVPLFGLVVGAFVGEYLGTTFGIRNILGILGGFGLLGLSLIVVRLYNNYFKQNPKNQPVIRKVVEKLTIPS